MRNFLTLAACVAAIVTSSASSVAQNHLREERDLMTLRDMGIDRSRSVFLWPLGTAFDTIRRYGIEPRGAAGYDAVSSAAEPLLGWFSRLLTQHGAPNGIRLASRLDPKAPGVKPDVARQIEHFNGLYPPLQRRAGREETAVIVHALPLGSRSSSYAPFADERMIFQCHQRICVILSIDLSSMEALQAAEGQLAILEKTLGARPAQSGGSVAIGHERARQLSVAAFRIESDMTVFQALNPEGGFNDFVLSMGGLPPSVGWCTRM